MIRRVVEQIFAIVPQQEAYIIEQFGRYRSTLNAGLHFLVPFVQRIAYKHSLKEQTFMIMAQNAVTKDNVIIQMDGVLYLKIDDPIKGSYGAEDPLVYAQILAQSVMRSEIGRLTLDQTFEERDKLNFQILQGLSQSTQEWGIKCLRYEIKDVKISETIRKVMNLEAEAERQKRADVLKSEAQQQQEVNLAEAYKRSKILKAQGQAAANILRATAISQRITQLSKAMNTESGDLAARFSIAEQFVDILKNLQGKNILINADLNDPKEIVSQALKMVDQKYKI